MSKHKYVSGLLRRRARTGRLVLNRRDRILNGNSPALDLRDRDNEKAIKELTITQPDSSVLVVENDHSFSKLDAGSFMIFKADKPGMSKQTADAGDIRNASSTSKNKAIFSQSLHIDNNIKSDPSHKKTHPQTASKHAGKKKPSDQQVETKPLQAATVVPLHDPHRKINKPTHPNQTHSDHASIKPDADSTFSTMPDISDAPDIATEPALEKPTSTDQIWPSLPHDSTAGDGQISDDYSQHKSHQEPDSEQTPDNRLTIDDKILIQNWEIGKKVGTAMETIVAEAIGEQVRRLTRNIIRDMLDQGVLQLPENTHPDETTDKKNNA
jgi:hypothetical protein